ncbi:MAG: OmpA family protein, partial [Deltaproteobacteria bacterium]|jgi:chemotaxis protein MotB|nr:OmpA family protein [Deltaproteobacteria bacterium]
MSADKKNPPIIKKIIKKGHGGHHGGSWKVAYADFVTAMMAFFLVMWLLAISSEQGKAALAEYFDKLSMSDAVFNGGLPTATEGAPTVGILTGGCFDLNQKGKELEQRAAELAELEKALADRRDERPNLGATRPTDRPQNPDLTDLPEGQEGGEGSNETGVAPGDGASVVNPGMGQAGSPEIARAAKRQFISDLSGAIGSSLSGSSLGAADVRGQFMVEDVPGGIRIQLMDKEGQPMFLSGQPRLTPLAMVILGTVAERLKTIPNKVAVEGHTDAVRTTSQELTNWELSTARASASRRYLARNGLDDERLTMVAGFAATQPLPGTNPTDPVNRRIAIMIWDQPVIAEPPPASNGQSSASGTPPEAGAQAPPAGSQTTTPSNTPPPVRRNFPDRPSQESLEQMLLEQTLQRAATPDTSAIGNSPQQ